MKWTVTCYQVKLRTFGLFSGLIALFFLVQWPNLIPFFFFFFCINVLRINFEIKIANIYESNNEFALSK